MVDLSYVVGSRSLSASVLAMMLGALGLTGLAGCAAPADGGDGGQAQAAEATSESSAAVVEAPVFERIEHNVAVGPERFIHVTETRAVSGCKHPHGPSRAVVMLPGPITRGTIFDIDVPGYDSGRILAAEGFSAFAVDFEGSGLSYYPPDGLEVTTDTEVQAVKAVVDYVHWLRKVPKVDVLGESWGGGVAAEVCAYRPRVRSCVLSSMTYKNPGPAAVGAFGDPGFVAFIESAPNHYLQTAPPLYFGLVVNSPPAVQAWVTTNQPWNYSTRPFEDFFHLPYFDPSGTPFFDPSLARVPAIIIRGENDPNTLASDAAALGHDYDRHGAPVITIPGAGHIPRIEAAPANEIFWQTVLAFLDP